MRFDGNSGSAPNYEPNSTNGPTENHQPLEPVVATVPWKHELPTAKSGVDAKPEHQIRWLAVFSPDPRVIETGSAYLRIVGPTYGFLGLGLALYFASQGAA